MDFPRERGRPARILVKALPRLQRAGEPANPVIQIATTPPGLVRAPTLPGGTTVPGSKSRNLTNFARGSLKDLFRAASRSLPRAYAHGYLLPPLRGLMEARAGARGCPSTGATAASGWPASGPGGPCLCALPRWSGSCPVFRRPTRGAVHNWRSTRVCSHGR